MPINVFFERYRDALFVANFASDGISVIDGVSDKVVGRVSFDVIPPRSGNIKCDNITAPLERNFYLDSGISCKAIPNKGFEFLSWEENLSKNSTQLINASKPATPLESILDFFNLRPEEPEATLKVSAFGSFTANFRELPPPLPPAYWATLFGFVLTTGLGAWLIPSLLRWTRSKAEIKKSNYYHQTIKSLYADRKLDEKNIKDLDDLERDITDIYLKGKINEIHYSNLKKEISIMYDKIFRKNIDSLKDSSDKTNLKEQLNKLKNYIEITQSEQKITEPQFNLLNKKISEIWDEANYEAEK